ncbi:MAG: type I secretion system permease/ATPase [Gammaproteobacteria bacterium]|nr:type I secretion system permease/ATPase [Gammaproteobacteria bacterium]MCH9744006.1 type I secretion system permease/ATPase [Gammaproteobacteria bacterium]
MKFGEHMEMAGQNEQYVIRGDLLACLVELTAFYERRASVEALTSGLPLMDGQLTPDLFQRAAERAELLSKRCKLPFKDIHSSVLPCILCLQDNQFCVLLEINDESATIFANQETQEVPLEQLSAAYTGRVILAKPKNSIEEEPEEQSPFHIKNLTWFWNAVRNSWITYSEVFVASFFINVFALALPLFVMNVYDRVVPNGAIETLWTLAIGVIIIFIFDFLLKLLRTYFIDNAAMDIDSKLSTRIFEHVIGIRMGKRPNNVGKIFNAVHGFESFRDFITSFSLAALIDFPFSILFIIVIGLIGGKLFLVPLILMPIIIVVSFIIQAPLVKIVKKNYAVSGEKQQTLIESLIGIAMIKSQNAEGVTQRKWEALVRYGSKLNVRLKFLTGLAMNFSTFSQYMGSIIVVILGVYMIANNQLTVGALIACTMLTGRTLAPISQLVNLIMRYYQSVTNLKNIDDLMKLPNERPADKKFLHLDNLTDTVEFKDSSFSYGGSTRNAVEGINFKISPGERIAVIGKVGSGKSTLLKLAMGLYEATQGTVLFSGHNIKNIDPTIIRKHVGYVPQDPVLFSGSIRENIAFSNPCASDDAILSAASVAGLASCISEHADGIDIQVGERGENLSGGQRQAVSIAQALINDPKFLIFDEPSTSMDDVNEAAFKDRIKNLLAGNRTFLLSTHKMSMLSLVQRIIVLDAGSIVLDGPKEEVLQALKNRKVQSKDESHE